jgi:non-heme chloroperoxidase
LPAIGRHGTKRVAKAVLIGAIPPLMLKTPNPAGTPKEVFDQLQQRARTAQFWKDRDGVLNYNRKGAKVSKCAQLLLAGA